jgi:chemotaxis protein MotA
MDIATLVGILVVFLAIMFGGGMAAQPDIFYNGPSIAMVVGGLIGATMIGNPMANLLRIVPVYLNAIKVSLTPPFEIIETIVGFAETARREGILALESAAADAGDEFLSSGIRLAVDGTEPDLIEEILETELMYLEERHKEGADIISTMATMAPAYGMIGTLVGLVLMLANMEDPSQIGAGMAIALLTTLYGSILANMLLDPVAAKLKTYSKQEVLVRKIIIQGIMSIQSGDNPRVVETKLSVMLPPSDRPDPDAGEAAE